MLDLLIRSNVIVNGCSIFEGSVHTGALPGEVLRSGRDTELGGYHDGVKLSPLQGMPSGFSHLSVEN